jgi:hypothetical protein
LVSYCFPEPCGHSGPKPSPKHVEGFTHVRSQEFNHTRYVRRRAEHSDVVPELSVLGHHDICEESKRGQLLALQQLRRGVERRTARERPETAVAVKNAQLARDRLRELIAALDARVPRVERAGEAAIARDAAALRAKAVKRLEEIEHAGGGQPDSAKHSR